MDIVLTGKRVAVGTLIGLMFIDGHMQEVLIEDAEIIAPLEYTLPESPHTDRDVRGFAGIDVKAVAVTSAPRSASVVVNPTLF